MESHFIIKKFFPIILIILISGCSNQNSVNSPLEYREISGEDMLSFEISSDKTTYRPNEEINVRMVLRYQGVEPILVNRRLGATPSYLPECMKSVIFTITDPLGDILNFTARINIGCPKPEDFIILNKGEEISRTQRIGRYFDFGKAGIYTIQAAYNNTSNHPDGNEAWKGTIESNIITIEITP